MIDALHGGIRSKSDLAIALGTKEEKLYRLLGALEALGLATGCAENALELTETGHLLRSDRVDSLRPLALLFAQDWHVSTWEHLADGLTLNEPAFDHFMGMPLFEYLQNSPNDRVLFDQAMDSLSTLWGPTLAGHLDLSRATSVIDVGGGRGLFLAEILLRHPQLKGCLFDLPEAIEQARKAPSLQNAISQDRCEFAEGSFFTGFPAQADAHVMKFILHDWGDEEALKILENSRQALEKGGELFIVDQVIDPTRESPLTRLSDIEMLLFGSGKERTAEEFTRLLERAGFMLEAICETATPFSIIQATPAPAGPSTETIGRQGVLTG
ncbi:methyltransferase [Pseudomonas sp. NPDC089734]|uniref:methyltransferase n=1 Tax=Pseudomonas sp. NPDC089734 TaxID=3364469 RepID=UPI00381D8A1B